MKLFITLAIFLLALIVAYLSFTGQPSEAYVFPKIVSSIFVILALINLSLSLINLSLSLVNLFQKDEGVELKLSMLKNMVAGLVVSFIYVFWAISFLGFYSASFLAFAILYSLYQPTSIFSLSHWAKKLAITFIFMFVIYLLFAIILQVQTPFGVLF